MKIDPKRTVFLIDGSSFLYRAYYGVRPLHTPEGIPVQAVYSFCRMIKKLIDTFRPEYLAIVWDSKGKTTRHDMYEDYKATRQPAPSDIFDQKKYIVKFANLIGITQIAQDGIEADDIIYSIAQECKKVGNTIVMITSDKDMAQALDSKTIMYDPLKDEMIDTDVFEKKHGFPVSKLSFYFGLLGDASDNIPGVRGIGKKGAAELVRQFDSLEHLYENLDKVKSKRAKNALSTSKKKAFLSRELFLLQYHPSELTQKDLDFDKNNWPKARSIFKELHFKSLLRELGEPKRSAEEVLSQYDFRVITTQKELDDLCVLLERKKIFALDTETDGVMALQSTCVGISICMQEGTSYYIPFGHTVNEQQLKKEKVVAALKPILEDEQYKKYLHNAKFDVLVLHTLGIRLRGVVFDTMIAARLVVRDWQRLGLKNLSDHYFKESMLTFKEVVKDNKYKHFGQVPLKLATLYAAADAHQTFRLVAVLQKELKQERQQELYRSIEHPLIQILTDMEIEGISVDVDLLYALNKKVSNELRVIEEKINALVEQQYIGLNLNSPKQIEQLLFYDLGLPPQKKSAKGKGYSTDQEVLITLAKLHPVPDLILRYRELFKLKSTYIEALPTYVNPNTQRIHTSYSQTVVATGRLASSDPNLQNIPADGSGYGIEIRRAFKPKEGNIFLSADYSQIELRVLSQLSKDKNLVNAFLSGQDIHKETAARLFDVAFNEVTNDQRQIGKRINFSILYGLTPYGLSKDLGISFKDAKKYIDKYFAQYPGVSVWIESIVEGAKKNGYITTHWGRKRYVPTIYEQNPHLFREAKRIAINTVAQGTAAEIMKIGMINLYAAFKKHNLGAQMLLQIHDELLISVSEQEKNQVEEVTKKILESVVDWHIPLIVTTRFGSDWKEVTK
ncbi:DNA polymerase I [Candidatus Dependentiae bacterium]|nr:DNA polymerase I [Candidatus Dependentiae bacterium]